MASQASPVAMTTVRQVGRCGAPRAAAAAAGAQGPRLGGARGELRTSVLSPRSRSHRPAHEVSEGREALGGGQGS